MKTLRINARRALNSPYAFVAPYYLLFIGFILLPILGALMLSLTNFNGVTWPGFTGLANYIALLTQDTVFMQHVLPNTLKFALVVGPASYALGFFLAWMLSQVQKGPRTILALLIFSPSMTSGVAMQVVWKALFSGSQTGYLNAFLLEAGLIVEPMQWLQSPQFLFPIMVLVAIWGGMGVGFLAMLSGILNINPELYEAAYVDGLQSRFQEIIYVTIPSMKPQMLFGAVMAIVETFQAGSLGVQLAEVNPTPQYTGQLMVDHMDDFGFIRFEMGYAAALAVVLLGLIYLTSKLVWRWLGEREEA